MQKEMQEAAEAGFRYVGVMGGETSFGCAEVVVVMMKAPGSTGYGYRLLATKKTSTLPKELAQAGQQGFLFVGLTVSETATAGTEVVAILRRKAN